MEVAIIAIGNMGMALNLLKSGQKLVWVPLRFSVLRASTGEEPAILALVMRVMPDPPSNWWLPAADARLRRRECTRIA
jgi:hypothetical protein